MKIGWLEIGSQRSEVGGQKIENGRQKSAVRHNESAL
jgi:hypothetical protein